MLGRVSTPTYGPPRAPERAGHRRRKALLLVAAGVAVVTVSLAGLAAVEWNPSSSTATSPTGAAPIRPGPTRAPFPYGPASGPTDVPGTSTAFATPGSALTAAPASPSAHSSRSGGATTDRTLRSNRIYDLRLAVGKGACRLTVRRPIPPLKDSELGPYIGRVVACLVKVFTQPLAQEGIGLSPPKAKTFRGTTATPCGKLTAKAAPAYYCAATATIYVPVSADDGSDAFSYVRLGYVALIAHEFGHHLQAATGIVDAFGALRAGAAGRARYGLTRRLELQAECFSGVFLGYVENSLHITGQDRYELQQWHASTGDEDPPPDRKPDHGTSRAQIRWLFRGLDSADVGRCNTWSASAASVT
jgi:hypothetical protein